VPSSITDPLYSNKPTTLRAMALDGIRMTVLGRLLDGAPLPDTFEPDPHHRDELEKARAHLAAVEAQTPADAEAKMKASRAEVETTLNEIEARRVAAKARYDTMIARAERWDAPANVAAYKALLIRHLTEMRDADCRTSDPPTERMDLDAWRARSIENAKWAVEYHEEQWAMEQASCAERSAFVRALRTSLPADGDPDDEPICTR